MPIPTDTTNNNLNRSYVMNPSWVPGGFVDQFIRKVPFQRVERATTQVKWNRLPAGTSIPSVAAYAADGILSGLPIDVATLPKTVTLQRIGDMVQVDYFSQMASGDPTDLLKMQMAARKVGVIRSLGLQIVQGNGVAPQLSGLGNEQTVDGGPSFPVTGGVGFPTLQDLHKLVNAVRASDGFVGAGADCLMTHERVVRFILAIAENAPGGAGITWQRDADLGVPVPHFQGIPIYIGQAAGAASVPGPAVNYEVWALKLTGPTGIRVLHAGGDPDQFGVLNEPVPMQMNRSNLGAFVGGFYGLMVPEPQSLARLTGITEAGLATQNVAP